MKNKNKNNDSFRQTKKFPLMTLAASLITLGLGYWFYCHAEHKQAKVKSVRAFSVR